MENEAETFAQTIMPLLGMLRRKALHLAGSRSAADDLVHDTVERALRNRQRFCVGSNLSAWLSTIMYNLAMDRRRHDRRETFLSRPMLLSLTSPEPEVRTRWDFIGREEVDDAIGRLEPRSRYLLRQFVDGHASYRELSREMGVPLRTIGVRLLRARRKVRSLLEASHALRTLSDATGLAVKRGAAGASRS